MYNYHSSISIPLPFQFHLAYMKWWFGIVTSTTDVFTMLYPYLHFVSQDVVMAAACSGALEMSLTVLANPGQNVLMPSPGFGVYKCLAESRGVQMKTYKLVVSMSTTVVQTIN